MTNLLIYSLYLTWDGAKYGKPIEIGHLCEAWQFQGNSSFTDFHSDQHQQQSLVYWLQNALKGSSGNNNVFVDHIFWVEIGWGIDLGPQRAAPLGTSSAARYLKVRGGII